MAAAEIFAGTYSISAKPNRETQFVIDRFGFPNPPPLFIDRYNELDPPCIGMVDHNQKLQSPVELYDIPREKLEVIIDHHAIQSEAVTIENVIHINVRPWGSTSTLLYETYLYSFRNPSQGVASCMLSAILSDTLGLSSSTTTEFDIKYADYLADTAQIDNITELYLEMGTAKSDITGYSTQQVVEFDGKEFEFVWLSGEGCLVYWSTLETFTPEDVINDPDPYIQSMLDVKAENNYDLIYFSVVNSMGSFLGETEGLSTLLLVGDPETGIAMNTYEQPDFDPTQNEMDLSPRVSRKKDFIPPLDYYISHTNRSVHFPDDTPARSFRERAIKKDKKKEL
eukprot:CAMPEP_0201537304 /NCGR_PEP_ID=MMETSP0161_2-20130828/64364_1 /ASSEMBLY_ACC=CAM_ASM_000251 /TAXON_ID=180227 /ORGANISM="Neoparamoeba aestuarina, Strain SoJaBio B1-5/56/2" /LENGTH=338 /DNA_ID=CAMNT_0047943517 /DNA_START=210 /DNA_END=1226 /DNA_ORIENTATION=+